LTTPGEETFRFDHEYILQKESEKASKEKIVSTITAMQLMKAKQSIKDIIHIQLVYTCLEVQYLEINKQVLLCPLVIDRTRKMAWFRNTQEN
jgi:hypothetical protein